eukprot:389679-Prorocentrum_minimum.AAC.2
MGFANNVFFFVTVMLAATCTHTSAQVRSSPAHGGSRATTQPENCLPLTVYTRKALGVRSLE